jgi:hypothetical protein
LSRSGSQAPLLPAGVTMGIGGGQSGSPAVVAADGTVAFYAGLSGPGITSSNSGILYGGTAAAPKIIARLGDAAPGTDSVYASLGRPSIGSSGRVAYMATLTGGSATTTNYGALYAGTQSSPQLVARSESTAAGAGAGVTYLINDNTMLTQRPEVNAAGQVAFVSRLQGAGVSSVNDFGLFAGSPGLPSLIAREGQPAPGSSDNASFTNFFDYELADDGFVAFKANLAVGGGSTQATDLGLYLYDPNAGSVVKLAREGDPFDIGGGVMRTVADLGIGFNDFSNGGLVDHSLRGIAAGGRVAFALRFTDNTGGVFLATVPEPGTAAMALASILPMCGRRRRHRAG